LARDKSATERRPLLVTGMARSATSWVGRILFASGQFGYVDEPFNLVSPPGTVRVPVPYWYAYVTSENEDTVLQELADLAAFRYPLRHELARCRRPADVLHTAKMWRRSMRSRSLRPLLKAPHAVFSAEWFERRLNSQVVVVVRHPAAVVSSWKRLGWGFDLYNLLAQPALLRDWLGPMAEEMKIAATEGHDAIDRIALLWRAIYSVVAEYQSRFPAFIVVRHEDLSREPTKGFAALYRRLGLTYSKEVADVVSASTSKRNPEQLTVEDAYRTAVNSAANVDAWKRRLTLEEAARIRALTAPVASRFYADAEWDR
jgi:hypothetical protein